MRRLPPPGSNGLQLGSPAYAEIDSMSKLKFKAAPYHSNPRDRLCLASAAMISLATADRWIQRLPIKAMSEERIESLRKQ
jgi:hypothetical protein